MPAPIYALVLAGGSGERFWPLSQAGAPQTTAAPGLEQNSARRNFGAA